MRAGTASTGTVALHNVTAHLGVSYSAHGLLSPPPAHSAGSSQSSSGGGAPGYLPPSLATVPASWPIAILSQLPGQSDFSSSSSSEHKCLQSSPHLHEIGLLNLPPAPACTGSAQRCPVCHAQPKLLTQLLALLVPLFPRNPLHLLSSAPQPPSPLDAQGLPCPPPHKPDASPLVPSLPAAPTWTPCSRLLSNPCTLLFRGFAFSAWNTVSSSPPPTHVMETTSCALRQHILRKALPTLLGFEATRTWVQIWASPA